MQISKLTCCVDTSRSCRLLSSSTDTVSSISCLHSVLSWFISLSKTCQRVCMGGEHRAIIPRIYTLPFGGYRIARSSLRYWLFTIDRECSGACCFACSRDMFWLTSSFQALLSRASIFVKIATTGTAPYIYQFVNRSSPACNNFACLCPYRTRRKNYFPQP